MLFGKPSDPSGRAVESGPLGISLWKILALIVLLYGHLCLLLEASAVT